MVMRVRIPRRPLRSLVFLLLLGAAADAQTALEARVELAIKRGCRYLEKQQTAEGVLGVDNPRLGAHALCMLALLSSGVDAETPVIRRALRRLRGKPLQNYDIAVRLMVLEKLRRPGLRKFAKVDARRLIRAQSTRGGWSYSSAPKADDCDNSNTQYAILGLRAADMMGLQVPTETWRRALSWILAQQHGDGGVGYSRISNSTSSMTAGALSSLVVSLARSELPSGHRHVRRARIYQKAQRRFLEKKWRPKGRGHAHYTLYGLERAMALGGIERLGKRDWYEEGARYLLDTQAEDGRWNYNTVDTAFALLFLSRPTRPTARETLPDVSAILATLDPQSRPSDIDAAVKRIVPLGREVATLLVHYLGNDTQPVREAAVRSLRHLYGKSLGYDARRSPRANAEAIEAWRHLIRG